MTRSQGKKGGMTWVVQVVHISDPPVNSAAALALLAKKCYSLDRSIYSEFRMTRIRNKWMKLQMKTPDSEGGLTCAICGLRGLRPNKTTEDNLATLDHIIEICRGGEWNNTNNFQVACRKCNALKNVLLQRNNKPLEMSFN